jgi:hypothetical protein
MARTGDEARESEETKENRVCGAVIFMIRTHILWTMYGSIAQLLDSANDESMTTQASTVPGPTRPLSFSC